MQNISRNEWQVKSQEGFLTLTVSGSDLASQCMIFMFTFISRKIHP